jgi:PAP2 superfamily
MNGFRKTLAGVLVTLVCLTAPMAHADDAKALEVLQTWVRLSLELVRHTPTYTPPVASRALAYIGVTAFEVVALEDAQLQSLAGQLNGLTPIPQIEEGVIDHATVLHSALGVVVADLFANTGPTGQRALTAVTDNLRADVTAGLDADMVQYSEELGAAIGAHIIAWAASDGGAVIDNMGFPADYALTEGPEHWVPTNLIRLQQTPLLPNWGQNRPLAMPAGTTCTLPPPVDYSEDPTSAFYAQAQEVVDIKAALTPEQTAIARFWADDAMLSMTPPGHWVAIVMQIMDRDAAPIDVQAEVLARLGVAMADGFIGTWAVKYQYDTLRPLTYIRRLIDPKWESLVNTPPFPEYPSGHSVQSGAAATVLTAYFGAEFGFEDASRTDDGLPARSFPSFWAAAEEAGISRLYGGIHFRAAIEQGLEQGRCIGAYAADLQTRND